MTQLQQLVDRAGARNERQRAVGADAQCVLAALSARHKRLPSQLLYDAAGHELLARLRALPAHYPARAERELIAEHAAAIATQVGPNLRVVEPCHGDVARSIQLLAALDRPALYVPVDGDSERAAATAATVRAALPGLEVEPATSLAELEPDGRTLAFLPGTAIGCVDATSAVKLLVALGQVAGHDGLLLIGADATSDPDALARAYDDADGAAARWAKHALVAAGELCGVALDPDAFVYEAAWNPMVTRLELRLVCTRALTADGLAFAAGEPIVIEHRLQHTSSSFEALLAIASWRARRIYTARPEPMRLWLCERGVPRLRTPRWWQR